MSLSSIVPVRKAEQLIYTILPISIGLAAAVYFANDPLSAISVIGLFTPFFTIVLSEARIDEQIVKKWDGRDWTKGNKAALKKSFLSWNLYFETWKNTQMNLPCFVSGVEPLEDDIKRFTSSSVSSYAIQDRLWSTRASFYLAMSIPIISWAGLFYMMNLPNKTTAIQNLEFLYSNPVATALVISLLIWFLQFFSVWSRNRQLRCDVFILTVFRYVQHLLLQDSIENPKDYGGIVEGTYSTEDRSYIILNKQLNSLDRMLEKRDWESFRDAWPPIRRFTELKARRWHDNMLSEVSDSWKSHIQACTSKTNKLYPLKTSRKLGWLIYYSYVFCEVAEANIPKAESNLIAYLERF